MKEKVILLILLLFLGHSFCFSQQEIYQPEPVAYTKEEGKTETPGPEARPVLNISKTENDLFSIELREAEIGDLLRVLAHDYNLNIIMDKDVKGKISASFTNIGLEEALERIAENHNFILQKTGNVIKVIPNFVTRTFVLKYIEAKKLFESSSGEQGQGMPTTGPEASPPIPTQTTTAGAGTGTTFKANTIYDLLSDKGKVFYDNETNSIMVIDYPANVERVAHYLEKIDIMPQQVLIEARLVEVKLQKEHALGVNWQLFAEKGSYHLGQFDVYSTSASQGIQQAIPYKNTYYPPAQTTTGSETPFTITIFDENINVVLSALSNQLRTNILSAPRVTTVNNREAEIKVTQNLPWAEPEVSVEGESGTVSVTWKINFEEVGITLKVMPTINEDGKITMTLNPEVSEKTSDYELTVTQGTTEQAYTVPIIDKRTASTKVVIGTGQTLIIGGLIKDKIIEGESKVPLLGDIPYLGYLFKSKKEIRDKTELLIFVSPTIITQKEFKQMAREEQRSIGKIYMNERDRQEEMLKTIESHTGRLKE